MLMNVSKIMIILCSISLVGVIGKAQPFEHPGGLHSYKQIELARRNIASQKQPWTTAYEALIEQANRGLEKSPEAIADFNVPGYYKDAKGHRETMGRLSGDAWVAYSCAVAYQLTSNSERLKYAEKAIQVINAWATTNKKFSGYDGQLAMVDAGVGLVFAAELMTDYNGWNKEQRTAFAKWITSVYLKASTEIVERGNNWGDWGVLGCIVSHYYLDMEDSVDVDIMHIRNKINMAIASDGHMPEETKRGKRGLWYTYFALAPLTSACQIAQNAQGVDLFNYKGDDGAGIEEALDYLLRYCREPNKWPHYSGNDINPPKPEQYPGNLFEAMSGIYEKKEYEAWVDDARPIMVYGHHYAWSFPTLMHTMASHGNTQK